MPAGRIATLARTLEFITCGPSFVSVYLFTLTFPCHPGIILFGRLGFGAHHISTQQQPLSVPVLPRLLLCAELQ